MHGCHDSEPVATMVVWEQVHRCGQACKMQHLCVTAAMVSEMVQVAQVSPVDNGATVCVVGDTHGQLHDVLHM